MGSHCKSCLKPIVWALTVHGKRIPLDARPDPQGNVVLDAGVAHVLGRYDPRLYDPEVTRSVSHFVTCPDRDKHRKSSKLLGPLPPSPD